MEPGHQPETMDLADQDEIGETDILEVIDDDGAQQDHEEEEDDDDMLEDDDEKITEEAMEQVEADVPDRGNNSAFILEAHGDAVFCVDVDATNAYAVTGGMDDLAIIWSTASWQPLHFLRAHNDSIINVGFSPNSEYVATGCMDGEIKVWSVATGESVLDLDCGDDLVWLQWHPKSSFLIAGSSSGSVLMWNCPSGNMSYFSSHTDAVTAGSWLPGGRSFVTVSEDGSLVQWSPKNQQVITKLDSKLHQFFECPIGAVACHSGDNLVAAGGADGVVKLINLKTGKVIISFETHEENIESVAFSNSSPSLLASGSVDGKICIFTVDQQTLRHTCQHEIKGPLVRLRWHKTLPFLYSCSADGTVRIWDGRTGEQLYMCVGHKSHVLDFCAFNGGAAVISVSEDTKVLVYDVPNLPAH